MRVKLAGKVFTSPKRIKISTKCLYEREYALCK